MKSHATNVERPLSALDAIYGRRSVRAYTPHTLDRSTVRALLDAAVQAPTAMHEEPWLFVVVQDRRLLRRLSDDVKATWAQDAAAAAASGGRPGGDQRLRDELVRRLHDAAFDVFYGAGTLIVIGTRRRDAFAVADCWVAAENLMLAASALGLGTCCIGAAVPALNATDTKIAIGLPADVHAVAPIVVGVPADGTDPVSRREPEIVSWK
jgi:nitroreductase